ncbi:MAG: hypothetical protein M3P44_04080, partial [Actinomycetota bacterium]|nr:hypothetical protein [Actinomycetota bacterium]
MTDAPPVKDERPAADERLVPADVSRHGAHGLATASPSPALLREAQTVARALTRALPDAGVFVVDSALRIVAFAGALPAGRGHGADAALG